VISGNNDIGINSSGVNTIQGNFIGTDATGTRSLGNQVYGIGVVPSSDDTPLIGGTAPGAGNLISGNQYGIFGGLGTIQGNKIGTDVTGKIAVPNVDGIIYGGSTIGGAAPGAGNLISGNSYSGIFGGYGQLIQGNLIGTDVTGMVALGNFVGILGTTNSTIGGITATARNVISGNQYIDIEYSDGGLIEGNYIGTDASGESALSPYAALFATNCTVGGTTPEARNVIAASAFDLYEPLNSQIEGNFVGTNKEGTVQIGGVGLFNRDVPGGNTVGGKTPGAGNLIVGGVEIIFATATGDVFQGNTMQGGFLLVDGAHNTLIGGTTPGAGNTIFGSIVLEDDSQGINANGAGNAILGNAIYPDAGSKPISLQEDGVRDGSVNDVGDTDTGPNGLQNYPVLTAAGAGTTTTVIGTLNSTSGDSFRIEFFASPAGDPPGQGRSERYLGYTTVTTNGTGNVSFTATGLGASAVGEEITATATVLTGSNANSTSEVSAWISAVVLNHSPTAALLGPSNGLAGQSLSYSLGAADPDAGDPDVGFTYAINFNDGTGAETIPASANNGSGVTLAHSFAAPGTYVITLTATDQHGAVSGAANLSVTVVSPSSVSGMVFADFNDDGQVDFGEKGIPDVPITLTGRDDLGNTISLSQSTDSVGTYVFLNLRPGTYVVTEPQQPAGYTSGKATLGTSGGTVAGNEFTGIVLTAGENAMNYNYGEQPTGTGGIRKGTTAEIGFWNNKNGQALIQALNGGTGTQLGDWLAATLPHLFGSFSGGNNLAAKNNAYVASFFQSRFVIHGVKLDAQVLATALSVYVTSPVLDSTAVGTRYGFVVSGNGLATSTFNVGCAGTAFGVANDTSMTVIDILVAADAQAVNGVLYNGDKVKRDAANDVFSGINEAGE
jgi:hypothetical protein